MVITKLRTAKGQEADDLHYQLLLWAIIELGMAIFAASAAALRPLLKYIPVLLGSLYGHSHNKSHKSNSDVTGSYHAFDGGYGMEQRLSTPQSHRLDTGTWLEHGKGLSTERLPQVYHSTFK